MPGCCYVAAKVFWVVVSVVGDILVSRYGIPPAMQVFFLLPGNHKSDSFSCTIWAIIRTSKSKKMEMNYALNLLRFKPKLYLFLLTKGGVCLILKSSTQSFENLFSVCPVSLSLWIPYNFSPSQEVVVYIYLMPCQHLRLFSWQKQLKNTSIPHRKKKLFVF